MACSEDPIDAADFKYEPLEGDEAADVMRRHMKEEADENDPTSILEFLSKPTNLTVVEYKRDILDKLTNLNELYRVWKKAEKKEQFANKLIRCDYPTTYIKMHKQWHSLIHEDQTKQLGSQEYVVALAKATVVLQNACHASREMGLTIGKAGLVKILIGELTLMKLYAAQSERDKIKDIYQKAVFATLHNVIRHCNENRGYFRDTGAVSLFQFYLKLDNLPYRAFALLTLSYIIDDEENDKISAGNENIEFLVALLKSAVAAEDHREQEHGFHVTELVDGMTKLALNDNNKVTFVEVGVLPLLVKLLQEGNSLEEKRLSATALWTLAFHKDNKNKIRKENGCLKALEKLKGEEDVGLRKACAGALWVLKLGHVMISYNWGVKERVIKMKTKLQAAGYNVWMDMEKMGGDLLEAMAGAVEDADVVLICMSEKYKNSNNCRLEAEYACKLQRPYVPLRVEKDYSPDGWLGIMVGTKLYFDFSSDDKLEENFPDLVREIGDRGKLMDDVVDERVGITQPDMPDPENIKVALWGNTQIAAWLGRNGLRDFETKFKRFAGEHLLMLKKICHEAPDFFYGSLIKDLGFVDPYDIARFKKALEDMK